MFMYVKILNNYNFIIVRFGRDFNKNSWVKQKNERDSKKWHIIRKEKVKIHKKQVEK